MGAGQGVPLRIEVGPRDLAKGMCVSARRDRPGREGKAFDVPLEAGAFVAHVRGLLDDVQARRMPVLQRWLLRTDLSRLQGVVGSWVASSGLP